MKRTLYYTPEKPQDNSGSTISAKQQWAKEPFRVGLIAGLSKSRHFFPEVLFTKQWDQIYYERGFHFSAYLKSKGKRIKSVPKTPPEGVIRDLYDAFNTGAII